jgi:hypothetical protein
MGGSLAVPENGRTPTSTASGSPRYRDAFRSAFMKIGGRHNRSIVAIVNSVQHLAADI